MSTGIVKAWLAEKGYGWVHSDQGGKDLFAHISEIDDDLLGSELQLVGRRVRFDVVPNERKPGFFMAANVTAAPPTL